MNASISNSFLRRENATYQRLHRRYELRIEQRLIARASRPVYCIKDPDTVVEQSLTTQKLPDHSPNTSTTRYGDEEPYWMQHWPSSHYLEAELDQLLIELALAEPHQLRVLELGCGGGLLSLGLALRRMNLLATDYSPDALLLTKLNGYANQIVIQTRRIDWRSCSLGSFDLLIAADVAYDRSVFPALNSCLRQAVGPLGVAVFAEPYRSMGDDFIEYLLAQGWFVQVRPARLVHQPTTKKSCRFIVVRRTPAS